MSGDYDSGVLFDTPNRELASAQGRWLSPDPAGAGWNQYAYATDPNSFVDPTGLACYPLERKLWGGVCQPEVDPWGESWDIDTIDPTPLFAWQSPSLSFDNPVANSTIVFDDGSVYPIGVTEQITDGSNAELSGGGWVQVGYNWIDNDSTGGAVTANNGPQQPQNPQQPQQAKQRTPRQQCVSQAQQTFNNTMAQINSQSIWPSVIFGASFGTLTGAAWGCFNSTFAYAMCLETWGGSALILAVNGGISGGGGGATKWFLQQAGAMSNAQNAFKKQVDNVCSKLPG